MKARITTIAAFCGFLSAAFIAAPNHLMAQAPPGPLSVPPSQGPSKPTTPRPKRQEPQPRTTLAGAWKLNRDESDDPDRKIQDSKKKKDNSGGYPSGRTGGGVGFPYPGGGPGSGAPRGRGDDGGYSDPKLSDAVSPASSLLIELKKDEVDVTADESHKLIFYTDGRQLEKPTDQTRLEIAAHWDGTRLVSDEKSPEKGKMSREFELSQDGRQFYETLHVETSKSKTPVVIQYVYDIALPPVPLTHETDPNQPIMKRRADASQSPDAQPAQPSQPADPDQPTMKRKTDDSGTSTPAAQPPLDSTPDPDQPVMKRRTSQP